MWKVPAVALWAWVPFCWQLLWGQAPGVGVEPGHKPKQQTEFSASQAKPDQRGTKDAPLIVETHDRPKTDKEAAEAKKDKEQADYINRWSLRFAGIAAIATALLVFVGIGGIYAAICTLRAIEKQATLQAAAMTQWVSVENWQAILATLFIPSSPGPKSLLVQFDIANQSSFPLTAKADFRFFGNLPNGVRLATQDVPLFPRKPYKCEARLDLTEEQAKEFTDTTLRISVHGTIIHVGVAKEPSPLMSISGNLVCGINRSQPILEYENITMTPIARRTEAQAKGQKAN
jgi:hypothetical protein